MTSTPACVPGSSLALLTLVLLTTGCPSFTTRGSARNLEPGQLEVVTAMSFTNSNPLSGYGTIGTDDYISDDRHGNLQVGVGYGLTERLELGGRLMVSDTEVATSPLLPGLALDTKLQLVRSDGAGAGLDVAVDPTLTVGMLGPARNREVMTYLQLPVLMGLSFSPQHQLQLNPQVTWVLPHEGFRSERLIPSLGLAYLRRVENGWGVKPELTVLAPVDQEGRHFRRATIMVSLAVQWASAPRVP
jgi:hypothetical protein